VQHHMRSWRHRSRGTCTHPETLTFCYLMSPYVTLASAGRGKAASSCGQAERAGDVVVVTRLDRLARSTCDLLEIAERIKDAGAGLRSIAEPWVDTTRPAGRTVRTVFAGIADFERSLIVERT
jgi:DNA invertase Pin-like site-specific DNA recombinase